MKLLVSLTIGIVASLVMLFHHEIPNTVTTVHQAIPNTPTPSMTEKQITSTTLFVPYWTVNDGIDKGYNTYVYFGIMFNSQGVDTKEDGYLNLHTFITSVPNSSKKLLVLRLIDSSFNENLLQQPDLQKKLITQAIALARENSFDGIILDFEYNALGFQSVIDSITNLSRTFALPTHQAGLEFYQTIYGDAFYRSRPFDITEISKNVDGLYVMAYDFHKANGDPGPNFPLQGDEYNMKQMTSDFLKAIPAYKLTVIFGMFGYDWTIDDKKQSIKPAVSLSTNEIMQKFVSHCAFRDCVVKQLSSLETEITYQDTNNQKHDVWFENSNSAEKKIDVLRKAGITSIGYWANGYF